MKEQLKKLAVQLFDIGALKFGSFNTHANILTPVWFDLRVIVSHPRLMQSLSSLLWTVAKESKGASQICGVPYTALPIATLISVEGNMPMLIKRKEAKEYGSNKLIEGQFEKGETCIVIEDVVATGISVLKTVRDLKNEGLRVEEAFVILDREQGGRKNLGANGIRMNSLYTFRELMEYLLEAGKITSEIVKDVEKYLERDQAYLDEYINETKPEHCEPISLRIGNSAFMYSRDRLFQIMQLPLLAIASGAEQPSTRLKLITNVVEFVISRREIN